MSENAAQPPREPYLRVDAAHDLMDATDPQDAPTWNALAGWDSDQIGQQLERQTTDLLEFVQQQNSQIDVRQAELNAKLAQLDNELRTARLRGNLETGNELLREIVDASAELYGEPPESFEEIHGFDTEAPAAAPVAPQEFDEVNAVVAKMTAGDSPGAVDDRQRVLRIDPAVEREEFSQPEPTPANMPVVSDSDALPERRSDVPPSSVAAQHSAKPTGTDEFPQLLSTGSLGQADSGLDLTAMAASLDQKALESERRLLAERRMELDQRQRVLRQMEQETQVAHREAMESRLATEKLWLDIVAQEGEPRATERLQEVRAGLAESYVMQQRALDRQRNELHEQEARLAKRSEDLAVQTREMQQWFEQRQEELSTTEARLDARRTLMDRRQHRISDEVAQWEAQRAGYQRKLQGLLDKLAQTELG